MKLLLEALLMVLVLVAELVGLVALATRYTTTTEAHPLLEQVERRYRRFGRRRRW
jgi:hypothetical protein